ncbi:hypothetical protein FACS1894181_06230 [Bacteroidia bacterium]|nr:hypothetical protein FACS1894181_06230 [Bacteroidia bacterium]
MAAIVACLAAMTIFTGCPNPDEDNDPTAEYLSFRIEGIPATRPGYQVLVFLSGTTITSYAEHFEATVNRIVAACYITETCGYSGNLLVHPGSTELWKGNGSYVVLVTTDTKVGVADVTFNNGAATVKYSSFKPGYTIP